MRTRASLLISLALLSGSVVANTTPTTNTLAKSQKEISIMNNILRASLNAEPGIKVRQIKGAYLAGQGYVFNISASGLSGGFGSWKHYFIEPDIEFGDEEMMIRAEEMRVEAANQDYQAAMEVLRESSEQLREFAQQEREIEFQIREVERARRDLDLERRHGLKAKQDKSVEKDIKKLEAKIAELEKEKANVRDKRDDAKEKIKSTTKEKQHKAAEIRKQNVRVASKALAQTLCDYGAGLKSLNNKHYVNFILENATGNQADLVFVYSKAKINQCVIGDINAEKLLASATHYSF